MHPFSVPAADEYAPYYERYISLLPEGDIIETLEKQLRETTSLLETLSEEEALFRYAEGKWSIKEVVGHIIDTERIFAYRGLCFARGDNTPLPGFEQNDYVMHGDFDGRPTASLAGEFSSLRKSNLFLFSTWSEAVQARRGFASEAEITARAIPWILAGHERHHLNIIREKYLPEMK